MQTSMQTSMEMRQITTAVVIDPANFCQQRFLDFILQHLKDERERTCSREDGYIDHIRQIVDIHNHPLLDSGECVVSVTFEAECFKPDIGRHITTKVEMVFPHGIFSSLYVLRFLIPWKTLEDEYVYVDGVGYRHRTNGKEIRVGDLTTIEITNQKYDDGHFSCIAKLVDVQRNDGDS